MRKLPIAGPLLLLALLLSPDAVAQSETEKPVVKARVVRSFKLDGVLSPAEWGEADRLVFGEKNLIRNTADLSKDWSGDADLSGVLHVGFTATDLVLAGTVTDDQLKLNPIDWWLGDEIEVFFDLDLDPNEKNPSRYNADDYQLLLFPLATDRTWGFTTFGGDRGKTDGGFDGIRSAAARLDVDGSYAGFTFEVAIPLVNFPRLKIRRGVEIGFDLALVDADETFRQKSYMTWGGGSDLATHPDRFARLRFEEDLPAVAAPPVRRGVGWIAPLVILATALIVIFLVWRFRQSLSPITEMSIRNKLIVLAPLVGLVVLAAVLPGIVRDDRRSTANEELNARADLLREVIEEARREGILGTPETGPEPARVMKLLGGSPVAPPERYEYRTVFLREPAIRTTLLKTPVLDYARRLAPEATAEFVAGEPTPAVAVPIVLHLEPDPAARSPLTPGRDVGVATVYLENGETVERTIQFGREISDYRMETPDTHLLPEGAIAWRDREAGSHADEIELTLDAPGAVVRVEVRQTTEDGTLVAHGVTVKGPGGLTPLPLVTRTLVGVPTNLWRDRPSRAGIVLAAGQDPVSIPIGESVSRLWLFLAKPGMVTGRTGRPGPELVSLEFRPADEASKPIVLRDGVHVWPEFSIHRYREPRPDSKVDLAFRWTDPGSWPRRRDVLILDVPEGATTLTAEHSGDGDAVILAGLTTGRRVEPAPPGTLTRLIGEGGEYRLRDDVVATLKGSELTWYRDGGALRTSFALKGVLGSTLPRRAGPDRDRIEVRRLGDTEYLARFLALDRDDRDYIEIVVPRPDASDVQPKADLALYISIGLLLLGVLLLLVDLLSRLPRIRAKVTLGFAVTALVPLVLFFLGLSGVLEREVGRSETDTLSEQIRQIRANLEELSQDARRKARALLSDESLLQAIGGATYNEETDELIADIEKTASPFGKAARVYVEDAFDFYEDPGPRFFPRAERYHPFRSGDEPIDDLAYRWSRLLVGGTASMPVRGGRRTIAVETPIDATMLKEMKTRFGGRTEILLFSLRGYPYAGTLELAGEVRPEEMRERRRAVVEADLDRRPTIRSQDLAGAPHLVAYDLLRSRDGRPVALLGVALPREGFLAARTELRNLFFVLAAVILVLEVVVGNILTRRLTAPLTSLSRGARDVARGRFKTRVEVRGRDEISTLADAFNRMTIELGRRIDELSTLNAAIRSFSGSLDREHLLARALDAFRNISTPPDGLLIVLGSDGEAIVLAGFRGKQAIEPAVLPPSDGLIGLAIDAEAPEIRRDLAETGLVADLSPEERAVLGRPGSAVVVPFAPGRDDRGAVVLLFDAPNPGLATRDLEFLATLAQQVAVALETSRLYQLAIEDAGTDLYVHSYFDARLREETDRALRADRPLSILLLSFAELKEIYESLGEEEGNHILNRAARHLRSAMSGLHLMARADRDTIEVMLPEADKEEALAVATEIREKLGRRAIRLRAEPDREIHLTPHIGLATCPDDARSAEFLISEAQQALYVAVTDGRKLVDSGTAREEVQARLSGESGRYVFRSAEMIEILDTVDRIAASDVPILVRGETGVGKEVLAELVHERSARHGKPLIKVNCAALPETLLESELFGYERGAFTGADRRKPGRFELAQGGTIFLDEIGEIPPTTQVKLLRVLQDHRVERLGGTGSLAVDVRVIAATNIDLPAAIRAGRFREDLYFRLNVVSLVIPPLRARKEEIPDLVDHFVATYTKTNETTATTLSPAAMDRLFAHDWPGNVRELRNTIERALVISRDTEVQADEIVFPEVTAEEPAPPEKPAAAPRREKPAVPHALNDRQRRLMEIMATRESITTREYAAIVGVSVRTGNRDLAELIELDLIVKIGKRRAAIYRLADQA